MPFAKSNWECEPTIPNGGFFEFGQLCTVKNLTLTKGDHRPCFLHVSSEVECVVKSLLVVASVEILDLYALVGPMDSFDYRHIAKLQGTHMDPSLPIFAFRIDPSVIPREKVWQIQLKLSSASQSISRIVVHELTAQVERAHPGSASTEVIGLSTRRSSPRLESSSGGLGSSRGRGSSTLTGREDVAADASWSSALSASSSRRGDAGLLSTSRGALGSSSSAKQTSSLSSSRVGIGGNGSGLGGAGSLTSSLGRMAQGDSAALPVPPSRTSGRSSSSSRMSSSSGGARGSSGGGAVSSRGSGSMGMTKSRSRDLGPSMGVGGGQMQLREETAAVASVLNAVCEKMVGVVSDKTKNYLFRAGRRTERKVLDKMQRLEERIERFDQVLERSSIKKMGEIEDAVLSLDTQFKATHFSSPSTAAPTPTSARSS